MTHPLTMLEKLRRPRLLIDAAHLGVADYRRDRVLSRLLPEAALGDVNADAFFRLAQCEASIDAERRSGGATYSVARHIELLAAMIAEARLYVAKSA